MTNQPCWQGAATVRRESDLSLVAVQRAHGLLNGGALHGAAVHTENWEGQTEAPFTVTFTCILSPNTKHWPFAKGCRFLASQNPLLAMTFLFQPTVENGNMSFICARKAGYKTPKRRWRRRGRVKPMAVTWLERATQPRRFWWDTARDGQGIVLLEAFIWQLGKKQKQKPTLINS